MSGRTGYCVSDDHAGCPDTIKDRYECDCPCHWDKAYRKSVDRVIAEIRGTERRQELRKASGTRVGERRNRDC